MGQPGARRQFTTVPDLSMSATPMSINICNTEQAVYTINLGPGFVAPLTFTFSATGPSPVLPQLSFVTNNGIHTASVSNELQLQRGTYQMVVTTSDAAANSGNLTLSLTIETTPLFPILSTPANNAIVMTPMPMLTWGATTGADNYRVEVARDENITDIVSNQVQTGNKLDTGAGPRTRRLFLAGHGPKRVRQRYHLAIQVYGDAERHPRGAGPAIDD